ncbi:TonB-dependent receptor [Spongiibacter sp. KMU-158]|uniref:TonB-dependent receptor n=1 Tax=Spongiibacter pelagi TaxID=2760804 RepID=A0A927C2K7_9GAMM|nr:TonB-dependent receptor [Spongiibacter pelagi]MBD2860145.1 TonB-dependent receptor [Spongiibacter pelagi]
MVTAQKRAEDPADVPISIQAFGEEKLDAMGITTQADLQQLVPSLNISTLLAFTTVYLRGIGTDAFLTADPSVANYIDGIYFPFALGLSQDFGVLERVEVLKGPQGTLFGRNTTGGAMHIITRDPTLGEFQAQLNITRATYPELHTKAYVNIPVGEDFAVSVSPIYSQTEHYIQNVHPDPQVEQKDDVNKGVRVKMRWAPTDWADITLSALDIESDAPGTTIFPARTATDLAVTLGAERKQYQEGSDEASLDGCCEQLAENRVYYGSAKFFTPWFDIKLLASDQKVQTSTTADFDGTKETIMVLFNKGFDADIQTAELQFISNQESWGSEWMKWIFGLYHFEGLTGTIEPGSRAEALFFSSTLDAIYDPLQPILSLVDKLDTFDLVANLGDGLPIERLFATTLVETKSDAAFLQTTFTFNHWLDLTLGLRYQDESREMKDSRFGILVAGEELTLEDRNTAQKQDGTVVGPYHSEQTLSPKVSLELHPFDDETLIYLSYQEATKSATYNPLAVNGPATFAEPESVSAWEFGAKSSFFHGTLMINGAIFDYDMENLQVQFVSLSTGGAVSFENAESAHIRGLDFDFTWLIAPHLVEGLVLAGGMGWLETAEYTSYPNAKGYIDNSGQTASNQDFTGNRIVKTPEISGNLALAKSWWLGNHQFEVVGTLYFTDEFFNEPSNREQTKQPAYKVWGARVGYFYEPWNLRVSAFGANLTDEFYTRGIQPSDFGDQSTIAAPRTYGMRMSWEY